MKADLARLPALLERLERLYGRPKRPPPRTALEWILWENAAYLVPDDRREHAWRALKQRTGLRAKRILSLSRAELLELAEFGGMHPEQRVDRLLAIAERVEEEHAGDLERALALPLAKARAALKAFPGIGAPGADKILLFTGTHALPAFESNGLRALVRLGFAREGKSYAQTYRTALAAFEPHVGRGAAWLVRAHVLLRRHGQELCKRSAPLCDACPLAEECPSAS